MSRGTYQTLLDVDLFLPACWSEDRTRCRAAGIPADRVHRTKWRIAREQLDRARTNGVKRDWLTFDGEYGRCPEFLAELDAEPGAEPRRQRFVGDVPRRFSCRAAGTSEVRPEPGVKGQAAEEVARTRKKPRKPKPKRSVASK